jgi:hypothetical protein
MQLTAGERGQQPVERSAPTAECDTQGKRKQQVGRKTQDYPQKMWKAEYQIKLKR